MPKTVDVDLGYDQDGRIASGDFIKEYEGEGMNLGEQAAAAAMRVLHNAGLSAGDMESHAFRCQHVLHAFVGCLARTAQNRKAIREMFKDYFKDEVDECQKPASTNC